MNNIKQFDINGYAINVNTMGYNAYENAIKNGILIEIDQITKITIAIVEKIIRGGLDKYVNNYAFQMWNSIKGGDQRITPIFAKDFYIKDDSNPSMNDRFNFSITSNYDIKGEITVCYLKDDDKRMCSIFAFYKEKDEKGAKNEKATGTIGNIISSISIKKLDETTY